MRTFSSPQTLLVTHSAVCSSNFIFVLGSSIKDVGNLERGRIKNALKICRWKEVKNANMREGFVKTQKKSADVFYGWFFLIFFSFQKQKSLKNLLIDLFTLLFMSFKTNQIETIRILLCAINDLPKPPALFQFMLSCMCY